MIVAIRTWFLARSRREQLLLLGMLAVALPVLAWLLVVRPLSLAYDRALEEHLVAVDRHGRVLSLAELAGKPGAGRTVRGDLQLIVTGSAAQAGIVLQRVAPAGPDGLEVTAAGARAPALFQWLQGLSGQGLRTQQLTVTPQPDGSATLSARLAR